MLMVLIGILLIPQQTVRADAGDWPTYMMDVSHSGFNSTETILNASNVSNLKVHWQFHAASSISSQPVVAHGVVYWGSWDGYEHATDLNGHQLWQTFLGTTVQSGNCSPHSAGVAGSATIASVTINGVATDVVFVDGGNAHVYALRASDGSVLWSTSLGTSPNYMLWAGTTVYNGSVYVGVASYGDCPLITGKVVQLDVSTGHIQHSFNTVPSTCKGGSVWMVPTIDLANQALYISTGNGTKCKTPETLAFSLIELNLTNLALIDSWQTPASQQTGDSDFGSTPTLFTATIGGTTHQMIGLVNKNGIYYAFDRSHIGAGPVWQVQLSNASDIASSAWDGQTLYTAGTLTTINGKTCTGSVRAHDPATGTILWAYCAPGKVVTSLAVIPGVVFAGAGPKVIALNATTGALLFTFIEPNKKGIFWGCCSVSNGIVYAGNEAGNLYAFGL